MSFEPPTPPAGAPIGGPVPLVPGPPQPPIPGAPSVAGPPAQPPRSRRGRNAAIVVATVLAVTTVGAGVWVTALGSNVDDRDATIASLEDDNDELDDRASALEDDATATQDELDEANATVDSLADAVATVEDELADLEAQLDAVNAAITELESGTSEGPGGPTTAPDDGSLPPFDPTDERNDGIISDAEYPVLDNVVGSLFDDAPELSQEEAQDIADRACAATSPTDLFDVVGQVQSDYWPDGTLAQASGLVGAVAGLACIGHLVEVAG